MRISRRSLLKVLLILTGALTIAPFARYGEFLSQSSKPKLERRKIANRSELKPYSFLIFEWPTQTNPYHTNLVLRGREGAGMGRIRDLYAYNRVCTHLQCLVNYDPRNHQITCPCHGTVFDANDGTVIAGPAPRPLATIELEEEENGDIYAVDVVGEFGYGR